jgi:hypothetical protein
VLGVAHAAAPHAAAAAPAATAADPLDELITSLDLGPDLARAARVAAAGRDAGLPIASLAPVTEELLSKADIASLQLLHERLVGRRLAPTAGHKRIADAVVEHLFAAAPERSDVVALARTSAGEPDAALRRRAVRLARPGGSPRSVRAAIRRLDDAMWDVTVALGSPAAPEAALRRVRDALRATRDELTAQIDPVRRAQRAGLRRRRALVFGLGPSVQKPGVIAATHVFTASLTDGKWSLAKRAQVTLPQLVFGPVKREDPARKLDGTPLWRRFASLADPRAWREADGRFRLITGLGKSFQLRHGNPQMDRDGKPAPEVVYVVPGLFAAEASRDKLGGYVILPFGSPIGARIELAARLPTIDRGTYLGRRGAAVAWKALPDGIRVPIETTYRGVRSAVVRSAKAVRSAVVRRAKARAARAR